ncbi:hypothetical protein DPMN_100383 [Dreissena polymorpha]|uniref:Uncharacterized protein n=1 Tax=Dreissena polymorpha TaxID=45954 RepID=A0A9D4LFU2_DREPO|nr:hypothetical protein DPMN_100383 [Dreissena polymorpha]
MRPRPLRAASAAELLAFAKWFLRLIASAGSALAWLARYKRPMSMLSNTARRERKQIAPIYRYTNAFRHTEIAVNDRLSAESKNTVPFVPSETARRSGLASSVARLGPRDHP